MTENFDDQVWSILQDDQFIEWVNNPDAGLSAYWERWMSQDPARPRLLAKARAIVKEMGLHELPSDAYSLCETIWQKVENDISPALAPDPKNEALLVQMNEKPASGGKKRIMAAAAILLCLITGFYYFRIKALPSPANQGTQPIARVLDKDNLKRTNLTGESQVLYLVDGSKVTLQPGSSINHAVFLQKDKREIFLEGNAFFEVAKDPKRPFYVYTKDIIMQVLGTSFDVTTNNANGDITVVVKTGKVSVYKKSGMEASQLILTPNQRARYSAQTQHLSQSALDSAELKTLKLPATPYVDFNFEEMPVAKIFSTLESAYGVSIRYNEKNFAGCRITTSLGEEAFTEKLRIICAALGATYRIADNTVFIQGGSCNNSNSNNNNNGNDQNNLNNQNRNMEK